MICANAYSRERDEIIKVLTELSQKIAPSVEALKYNLDVLAQLDFIFAKARLSENWQAVAPKLVKTPELAIKQGRHPLIDPQKVVPLSLTLGEDYDSIIITGPNTGGKTVTFENGRSLCAHGTVRSACTSGSRDDHGHFPKGLCRHR